MRLRTPPNCSVRSNARTNTYPLKGSRTFLVQVVCFIGFSFFWAHDCSESSSSEKFYHLQWTTLESGALVYLRKVLSLSKFPPKAVQHQFGCGFQSRVLLNGIIIQGNPLFLQTFPRHLRNSPLQSAGAIFRFCKRQVSGWLLLLSLF